MAIIIGFKNFDGNPAHNLIPDRKKEAPSTNDASFPYTLFSRSRLYVEETTCIDYIAEIRLYKLVTITK